MKKIYNGVASEYEIPKEADRIDDIDSWYYICEGRQASGKSYVQALLEEKQKELENYKQRIDRAIEKLKKYGNGTFDDDLLNILQGSDE